MADAKPSAPSAWQKVLHLPHTPTTSFLLGPILFPMLLVLVGLVYPIITCSFHISRAYHSEDVTAFNVKY